MVRIFIYGVILLSLLGSSASAAEVVRIGMNYPQSGPYRYIGIDEERGAQLALDEINEAGGILGRQVQIYGRDSKSDPDQSEHNTLDLIEKQGVSMIFGGASSGVALRVSEICQKKGTLFMATVTSANETTGIKGHRHTFRASYSAWMGGKALGTYLRKNFPPESHRYFFIVADYSWGRSAEASIRKFSGAVNEKLHPVSYTIFPGVTRQALINKMKLAQIRKADVLVLCHFGEEMTEAIQVATELKLKEKMQIVVPILELSMSQGAGPEAMAGIVGTSDFNWEVPFAGNYPGGKNFVRRFAEKYGRYPCWGGAKAYTILWEYKNAVERAGSFEPTPVIRALEDHPFTLLKDEERWRGFDHQDVQTVFLVKGNPPPVVLKDEFRMDYFDIIGRLPGTEAARTKSEWEAIRLAAGLPPHLEKLPGE